MIPPFILSLIKGQVQDLFEDTGEASGLPARDLSDLKQGDLIEGKVLARKGRINILEYRGQHIRVRSQAELPRGATVRLRVVRQTTPLEVKLEDVAVDTGRPQQGSAERIMVRLQAGHERLKGIVDSLPRQAEADVSGGKGTGNSPDYARSLRAFTVPARSRPQDIRAMVLFQDNKVKGFLKDLTDWSGKDSSQHGPGRVGTSIEPEGQAETGSMLKQARGIPMTSETGVSDTPTGSPPDTGKIVSRNQPPEPARMVTENGESPGTEKTEIHDPLPGKAETGDRPVQKRPVFVPAQSSRDEGPSESPLQPGPDVKKEVASGKSPVGDHVSKPDTSPEPGKQVITVDRAETGRVQGHQVKLENMVDAHVSDELPEKFKQYIDGRTENPPNPDNIENLQEKSRETGSARWIPLQEVTEPDMQGSQVAPARSEKNAAAAGEPNHVHEESIAHEASRNKGLESHEPLLPKPVSAESTVHAGKNELEHAIVREFTSNVELAGQLHHHLMKETGQNLFLFPFLFPDMEGTGQWSFWREDGSDAVGEQGAGQRPYHINFDLYLKKLGQLNIHLFKHDDRLSLYLAAEKNGLPAIKAGLDQISERLKALGFRFDNISCYCLEEQETGASGLPFQPAHGSRFHLVT